MKKTYLAALILVMGITLTACKSSMVPNKSSAITGETAVVENQLSNEILIVSVHEIITERDSSEENAEGGGFSYDTFLMYRVLPSFFMN